MNETAFDYLSCDTHATFTTTEPKWIRKITALSKTNPNEVQIIYTPEQNNGTLYAHIPKSWLKVSPPKKMSLTEEQRLAAAERLSKNRKKKGGSVQ